MKASYCFQPELVLASVYFELTSITGDPAGRVGSRLYDSLTLPLPSKHTFRESASLLTVLSSVIIFFLPPAQDPRWGYGSGMRFITY